MKILMIGGTGTISYDATKYFLAQNHDVYLLNRGNRNNLSDERLNYIIGNANDAKSLESALDGKEFDVILDFILYNVNQMKERLAIYNNKCKQFIFISSATAYKPTDEIITEKTELGNDNWEYSRTKKECEIYLRENSSKYSFYYTIVRPYITYDNRRIPLPVITKIRYYSLINRIESDKPIIMCGDGNNKLTLTHTRDFAVALEGLLLNEKAFNEDFHITGDCVVTWNDILAIIEKILNKKAIVINIPVEKLAVYFPSERDELLYDKSLNHVFDNKKICSAVPQFKTTYTVESGLRDTINNLKNSEDLSKIDSVWDYSVNTIIEKYEKETKSSYIHKADIWSKCMYLLYQKSKCTFLKKVFNRLRYYRGKI